MSKNKFWYRVMTVIVGLSLIVMIMGEMVAAKEKVILKIAEDTVTATGKELAESGSVGLARYVLVFAVWNYCHPEAQVVIKWPWRYAKDRKLILTSLASGKAPAYYKSQAFPSLYDAVSLGAAADITKYVNDPELKAKYFDHMSPIMRDEWKNTLWIGDRCYGIIREADPMGIYYRKDWFKEAGIFNEQGVGAPPDHWTLEDFKEIAKKTTDPKKKRWGFLLQGKPGDVGFLLKRFGAEEVIPDKTGQYSWRAGFTLPPMVEYMTFLHDMIFEDKSVLTGIEFGWGECWRGFFNNDRGAMVYNALPDGLVEKAMADSPEFRPFHFADVAGLAPLPVGRGGIIEREAFNVGYLVNPLLTDAEKKATVEYLCYLWTGKGTELLKLQFYLVSDQKFPVNAYSFCGLPNTPWMKPLGYGLPPDYTHAWNLLMEEKSKPTLSTFGIFIKEFTAVHDALGAAYGAVMSTADINIEEELAEAADIANNKLNYKDKEVTAEKLKAYYTAVGEYYKETAPEFYKNTFQPLLEKYYKVW